MSFFDRIRLPTVSLRKFSLAAALFGAALVEGAYGCSGEEDIESFVEENVGEVSEALADEESDVDPGFVCPTAPACNSGITVNTTPSLVVTRSTHASILDTHFTLTAVLNRILAQSNVGAQSAENLYQRLWDTQAPRVALPGKPAGKFQEAFQPHCDDDAFTENGFPVTCRAPTAAMANGPTTTFTPVALFNRFDLSPKDGSHCGEYRIVYANGNNTSFIIFEAQLPNPHPQCGIETCRPVAQFWRNLSTIVDPVALGNQLKAFYFDGLTGFRPVIHPNNYGLDSSAECQYGTCGGQIRTNDFVDTTSWHLAEFQLGRNTTGGVSTLFHRRVSVKTNPFGQLFSPAQAHPLAAQFQGDFVAFSSSVPSNVGRLAASTLNGIGMEIEANHNAGQSESFGGQFDNYVSQFGAGGAFKTAIQTELTRIGSGLSPDNIIRRAMTQSCAGCHQLSNNNSLGGGLTWPSSSGFFHVSRQGTLSNALNSVFLPHRKTVLETFLRNCPPAGLQKSAAQGAGSSLDGTLGGSTTH